MSEVPATVQPLLQEAPGFRPSARSKLPSHLGGLRVRALAPNELTRLDVQAWSALESRALEPNAYASPHFVLPALRHSDPGRRVQIILVERVTTGRADVVGVAAVLLHAGTRLLPVPHLEFYQSRHSYLGSPLIDQSCAGEATRCLLDHLRRYRWMAAGMVWPRLSNDGPLQNVLREAAQSRGMAWNEVGTHERAVLIPAQAGPDALKRAMGKGNKEIERCWRRLSETGSLQWSLHRGEVSADAVEAFLRLEHSGWKAETRSSLRSDNADEAFFKDMVAAFSSEDRALFTELSLDGKAIASTSNLISGTEGFAFKVGWDQGYRKFGVGILNEAEFVRQAPVQCVDLRRFDSGSQPDSFIERMWPARRTLATAFTAFSAVGNAAWRLRQKFSDIHAVDDSAQAAGAQASSGSPAGDAALN